MRTVTGPTDRVVVVGAGLGGLSAALRLAGAGRSVTVLERCSVPGGRAGLLELDGYRFDTGPTVLTMPELIADAFACVDEQVDDWLDLRPVDPSYRAHFPDGSHLDVIADVDTMAAAVRDLSGARDADGYRRFAAHVTRLFELERRHFIDRNLDSPLALVTPALARLVSMGGMRRMAPAVAKFFDDPRLRRVFSFQALYAGLSPYDALALYLSISYLDSIAGVTFPVGGMHAVPRALAAAGEKHGVALRYDTEVTRIEMRNGRAVAVHTASGDRVPADVVVVNADLPVAWRLLDLPARELHWSPSCVLLLLGLDTSYGKIAHHNLHFTRPWRSSLRELSRGALMTEPSLMVTSPTVTDPGLAPTGHSMLGALALVPNLRTPLDWEVLGPRYRDEMLVRLENAGYRDLRDAIDVQHLTTPADWARHGLAAGTPFSADHRFSQTGPFRTSNLPFENVVLVGCGTQPGIGVPMVLMSGRLAAERVAGAGIR